MENLEDTEKKVKEILELEKWRSFVSGKITGGLAVVGILDFDKEKKIEILAEALGLSRATATDFINDLYGKQPEEF